MNESVVVGIVSTVEEPPYMLRRGGESSVTEKGETTPYPVWLFVKKPPLVGSMVVLLLLFNTKSLQNENSTINFKESKKEKPEINRS